MKQNDKQNVVATIQKNLKIMQSEAQEYIDRHHTNLPPLCSARHYLFHSLSKRNTIQVLPSEKKHIEALTPKEEISNDINKATVYNIEFKKKFKEKPSLSKQSTSSKSLLNTTSLKMKMNGGWRAYKQNQTRYALQQIEGKQSNEKVKTIIMNSQIVGLTNNSPSSHNGFSPKMNKIDLSKKQAEMLTKYISRFRETKKDSIRNITQKKTEAHKKSIQQISDKSKLLTNEKQLFQSIEPIRKRRVRKIHLDISQQSLHHNSSQNPEDELILKKKQFKPKLNTFRPRKKQKPAQPQEYSPWQSPNNQQVQIEEFMNVPNF